MDKGADIGSTEDESSKNTGFPAPQQATTNNSTPAVDDDNDDSDFEELDGMLNE